jgi:hypothetical protein
LRQAHVFRQLDNQEGGLCSGYSCAWTERLRSHAGLSVRCLLPPSGISLPPRLSRSLRLSLYKAQAFPNVLWLFIQECCRLWSHAATSPWCTPLPLRYLWKHFQLTYPISLFTLAPTHLDCVMPFCCRVSRRGHRCSLLTFTMAACKAPVQ